MIAIQTVVIITLQTSQISDTWTGTTHTTIIDIYIYAAVLLKALSRWVKGHVKISGCRRCAALRRMSH